ncbi:hypothetical protein GQ457_09G017770 [Hibiscus cannabinus]
MRILTSWTYRVNTIFEDKSFSRRGDDVSTSSSARVADPEFLPQGPVTHSKAKQFKEALSHTCAKLLDSFDNLIEAPFSSTSAQLAQLKLNNPEVAETYPTQGRVSYGHVDNIFLDEDAANSSNFMAAIDAFLKHSSSSSFDTSVPAPIVDPEVLPQGPITRSDVNTSAPAPIVDPEVLPQGPITRSKAKQFREALFLTCAKLSDSFDINCALEHKYVNVLHTDVEIKGHDIMDLSSARLKFRSSYAARFNSTKCHTSAS